MKKSFQKEEYPMTDHDDTSSLQEILRTHRLTLIHYLSQKAKFSSLYVPPHVEHGILEARSEIQRIKQSLRTRGIFIEDESYDSMYDADDGFSIVLEHFDACGKDGANKVKSSVLNAISAVMLCRGANKIVIPAPGKYEYERIQLGIEDMPVERRELIKIVDVSADVLMAVNDYIEPIKNQSKHWPEDTFTTFLQQFLYEVSIAIIYKAGISTSSIEILRDFIPIIDLSLFKGESRYRLAEIINIICSYEPINPKYGSLQYEASLQGIGKKLWNIIFSAKFKFIVNASGKMGYIDNPMEEISNITSFMMDLSKDNDVADTLCLVHTNMEVPEYKSPFLEINRITKISSQFQENLLFSPPLISLGPVELSIYKIALREKFPGAKPPDKCIMMFEHARGGAISHSWLNKGEENKLEKEAKKGLKRRKASVIQCRNIQHRFFK
jgi:hypothetical protein